VIFLLAVSWCGRSEQCSQQSSTERVENLAR